MPKAKKEIVALSSTDHLPPIPPVQYSPYHILPAINGKNVASGYGKESSTQSWWTRRADDDMWEVQRGWKKDMLLGGESNALTSGTPRPSRAEMGPTSQKTRPVEADSLASPPDASTAKTASDPASKIIIIHPGARFLRIGRASDAQPVTIPNVVARRCQKSTAPGVYCDLEPQHDSASTELYTSKIEAIRTDLRGRMRALRLRGTGNGPGQAAQYNANVQPEVVGKAAAHWTDTSNLSINAFVGREALLIADPEKEGFCVRWPLARGGLNTFAQSGYSTKTELLTDIETCWLSALRQHLHVDELELKDYSAVLILPDLYRHVYLREMVDILFRSVGFKQISLQQESLGACFGAGLATACVIDIGASKMSVSCIEEGWVLPETRTQLAYGGDDITIVMSEIMRRQNFPYRALNLNRPSDWRIMELLKKATLVLSEGDFGLNIEQFFTEAPGEVTNSWTVRSYDEVILAPMTLFSPRIVDFDARLNAGRQMHGSKSEVDDVLDLGGDAITEAHRACTSHLTTIQGVPDISHDPGLDNRNNAGEAAATDTPQTQASAIETARAPPVVQSELMQVNTTSSTLDAGVPPFDVTAEASKVPLHVAVAESLFATGSEERAKRMISALMVVGGGGKIYNIGAAISSRIQPLLAARWPNIGEAVVVPPPVDIDARHLTWKGVSLLTRLDVTCDTWVRSSDWEALGSKAIKDRTLFI